MKIDSKKTQKEVVEKHLKETISEIFKIYLTGKESYQYCHYLYFPKTDREKEYLQHARDFHYMRHMLWKNTVVELHKLLSHGRRDHYSLVHLIDKLKPMGELREINFNAQKPEEWDSFLSANQDAIEQLKAMHNKIYKMFGGQYEWQKEDLGFSNYQSTGYPLNFGVDLLVRFSPTSKLFGEIGIGYLKHRVPVTRFYNRHLLEPGDSLGIQLSVRSHTHQLVRIPVSIGYTITRYGQCAVGVAAEYLLSFTFKNTYDGHTSGGGHKKYFTDGLRHYAHAANLVGSFRYDISKHHSISADPFVRIVNNYKKDRVFYENPSESRSRSFDAVGLYLRYNFLL